MSSGGDTAVSGVAPDTQLKDVTAGPVAGSPAAEKSGGYLDNLTCAICLDQIAPCNIASIPQCEHQYCVNCILFWATRKEAAWCPQCRVSFSQLRVYRRLDGTPRDLPDLESVCLLKRTLWFQEYAKAREQGLTPGASALLSGDSEPVVPHGFEDLQEYLDYQRYYEEYDEDDEVEEFYHSAAAGHARITLGNRRWGENGYVASGRLRARPVQNKPKGPTPSKAQKGGKGKGAAKSSPGASSSATGPSSSRPSLPGSSGSDKAASAGRSPGASASRASPAQPVPPRAPQRCNKPAAACSIPGADEDLLGTSPGGRRARRNARRAAQDEAAGLGWC